MKTKAAILFETGKPLRIEEIEIPPLARGQLLVKLTHSGVCHSQLMEARGLRGKDAWLPHLLGHEGSGEVLEIGEGVTKVKVGDKVVLGWIKGEGIEGGGAKYKFGDTLVNSGSVTTFSEMTIVSENRVVPQPDGVAADLSVLFGCAVPTGAGLVLNTVKPHQGSSIGVFGLGGIGLSALMATRIFECDPVIAVDVEESKLELAKELGATHTINAANENVLDRIKEITGGAGLDYAVEAAGTVGTIETAFEAIKRGGGRCVFASHPKHGAKISLDPFELICGKSIAGSWGGDSKPDRDVPIFAAEYLKGRFPLERLLSHRYPLEDINIALDDLESRKVTRALLEIQS